MDFIQVKIDKNKCLECEICTAICPEVFKLNKNSVEVVSNIVPVSLLGKCVEVSESCPSEAVKVTPPNIWKDEYKNS